MDDEKWNGYVIADTGHGKEWQRVFGPIDSGDLWSIIATAVPTSAVSELRDLRHFGVSCRVPMTLTINERTAPVRTIWHYENDRAAPRLVTAYPPPNITRVATVRQIELYDIVELLEPVDAAPAGAQGAVIHFLRDGTVAEIEITQPPLEGLDSIVYTTLDKLRSVG